MLGLAAHLPDAAVGVAPVVQRGLHLLGQDRPDPLGQVVARLGVEVERVEDRAPHVVLVLVVGAVADADRRGALVAGQVVERLLGQLVLAADAVHDLELRLLALGHVGHEVEEVVGLPVEPQRVEAPEHEGGVADPGVAVVPVALAARGLGQRGGGRGHQRAGGRVGEALERQRAALEVGAPGVVGELAVVEPVLPVVRGPDQAVVGVLVGRGRRVLGPRQRHEQRVALLHHRPRGGPRALDAHVEVGGQPQLDVHALGLAHRLVVARARRSATRRARCRSRTAARSPC